MPGPPTINWYRADLRLPPPGGLSRPADHLYQSPLFPPPTPPPHLSHCSVRKAPSALAKWRRLTRQPAAVVIDVAGDTFRGTWASLSQGSARCRNTPPSHLRVRAHARRFSRRLLFSPLTSSPFRSRTRSPMPFALHVASLSNTSSFLRLARPP